MRRWLQRPWLTFPSATAQRDRRSELASCLLICPLHTHKRSHTHTLSASVEYLSVALVTLNTYEWRESDVCLCFLSFSHESHTHTHTHTLCRRSSRCWSTGIVCLPGSTSAPGALFLYSPPCSTRRPHTPRTTAARPKKGGLCILIQSVIMEGPHLSQEDYDPTQTREA